MLTQVSKSLMLKSLLAMMGRRNLVRLGRFLYHEARLDSTNCFESNGEALIQSRIPDLLAGHSGAVVLDVGANAGQWSRRLSTTLKDSDIRHDIYAFEPCSETFETLQQNLSRWKIEGNVSAVNLALSSETGSVPFHSLGQNEGRNSIYAHIDEPVETVSVPCDTIDSWTSQQKLDAVDFLKIDAEGHDYEVMLGARRLLQSQRIGMLQFEYNHRWIQARRYLKDAFELLTPCDYRIGKVTKIGIEFYSRWDPELESFIEGNYIAIKPDWMWAFPAVEYWKNR